MNTFRKKTTKAEFLGLQELEASKTFRIPKIFSFQDSILEIERIETSRPSPSYWEDFGVTLSKLHRVQKPFFGWNQDGTIGQSPQKNTPKESWVEFFIEERLNVQMKMLQEKSFFDGRLLQKYSDAQKPIHQALESVSEKPCLLHGDLWNGNALCDKNQTPTLIDPAVYYGHRETDLAMMKLFGGFHERTFSTYNENYPLEPGWELREKIYNLYHVLNHANIFGPSYLGQATELLISISR